MKSKGRSKPRISIRKVLEPTVKTKDDKLESRDALVDRQTRIRELLRQRAKGIDIDIEAIRNMASKPEPMVQGDHNLESKNRVSDASFSNKKKRLSLAKGNVPKVELPRPRISNNTHLGTEEPISRKTNSRNVTSMNRSEQMNDHPSHHKNDKNRSSNTPISLKDSVYFVTDHDYEHYLNEELERHGLFPELFEKLKVFYVSRQDIHGIMGLFEHISDLGLGPCETELEKADVFKALGDPDKTFLYLDKAIRIAPESTKAMRALAFFHKYKGEYELALHWFEKWCKLSPQVPEVFYQMGLMYYRLGNHDLCRSRLQHCLSLDDKHIMSQSLLNKITRI
jgi:tetratricopeptide (TPR) repeat protein